MKRYIYIGLTTALFCACAQPEIPIDGFDKGNLETGEVNMGVDYRYQIFYDLASNAVISSNLKTDWDFAYSCSEGNTIFLNSSKFMSVWATSEYDFSNVTDTVGLGANQQYDVSSGDKDSTAFGDLVVNKVYIINRGKTEIGLNIGFVKFQLIALTDSSITFQFANLDNSNLNISSIIKNNAYNNITYSFDSKGVVQIEPAKSDFDLIFTQYTYYFNDFDIAYLVTGVLLNNFNTTAAVDSVAPFEEIGLNDTIDYTFINKRDIIGYDWKYFDFDASLYIVDDNKSYIIRATDNFYFKIKFTDFYSTTGEKGNPVFLIQQL